MGDWIQTYTGKAFDLLDPREEAIDIEDIAHSLACINRYGGHTRVPYSVAQHSVIVSNYCALEDQLEGLLHDAAEAYTGDVKRPVKKCFQGFAECEHAIEQAIARKFKLRWPWPPSVLRTDNELLAAEARDLMRPPPRPWTLPEPPLALTVKPWDWEFAKEMFTRRFYELTATRK